jgi:hypothetical protein
MRASCDSPAGNRNHLVENNIFENNATHIRISGGDSRDIIVRNNTFIATKLPPTDLKKFYHITLSDAGRRSPRNVFKNNIFYSTLTNYRPIQVVQSWDANNVLDFNIWDVATDKWVWKGRVRKDFRVNYNSITSWDPNGKCL